MRTNVTLNTVVERPAERAEVKVDKNGDLIETEEKR